MIDLIWLRLTLFENFVVKFSLLYQACLLFVSYRFFFLFLNWLF